MTRGTRYAALRDALTPEFKIVAACCRPIGQSGRSAAIAVAATTPFDPEKILGHARAHRVEALVAQGLAEAGIMLPDAATERLQRRVQTARLQMLRNAAEEVRVGSLLHAAGVDALFVKGATLAMLAYGSLAHKASWDIDLLVARDRVGDAVAVLHRAGYAFDHPEIVGTTDMQRFLERYRETSWTHAARGTTIELHWALADNPRMLPGIGIGSGHLKVAIAGHGQVATLGIPDLFAFLAVHGTAHGWSRLKWLADLAALTDAQALSLANIVKQADARNAGRCMATALLLMRDLLGTPLPPDLEALINRDRCVSQLACFSLQSMLAVADQNGKTDGSLSQWWALHHAHMIAAPGIRYALAEIATKLTRSTVPRRLRLPRWLLIPDALFVAIPLGLARRVAQALQPKTANSP